jgi:hypothetical protein
MMEASWDDLTPDAMRLRVQEELHRDILSSLSTRTTVEAIEAANLYLRNPNCIQCTPAEREELVAGWQEFCAAAAAGGEGGRSARLGRAAASRGSSSSAVAARPVRRAGSGNSSVLYAGKTPELWAGQPGYNTPPRHSSTLLVKRASFYFPFAPS